MFIVSVYIDARVGITSDFGVFYPASVLNCLSVMSVLTVWLSPCTMYSFLGRGEDSTINPRKILFADKSAQVDSQRWTGE